MRMGRGIRKGAGGGGERGKGKGKETRRPAYQTFVTIVDALGIR